MVTATVYCAPAPLRNLALAVYSLGSLLGLYKVKTINGNIQTEENELTLKY